MPMTISAPVAWRCASNLPNARTAKSRARDAPYDIADEGATTFGRESKKNVGAVLTLTPNLPHEGGRILAIDIGLDEDKL
jgi:hypothetical protein